MINSLGLCNHLSASTLLEGKHLLPQSISESLINLIIAMKNFSLETHTFYYLNVKCNSKFKKIHATRMLDSGSIGLNPKGTYSK